MVTLGDARYMCSSKSTSGSGQGPNKRKITIMCQIGKIWEGSGVFVWFTVVSSSSQKDIVLWKLALNLNPRVIWRRRCADILLWGQKLANVRCGCLCFFTHVLMLVLSQSCPTIANGQNNIKTQLVFEPFLMVSMLPSFPRLMFKFWLLYRIFSQCHWRLSIYILRIMYIVLICRLGQVTEIFYSCMSYYY